MEKCHLQLRKQLKIYVINQKLILWTRVPTAVSSFPAAAHMYRQTKSLNHSPVSSL